MTPDDVPAGPILVDTDVASWLLLGVDQATLWRPLLRGHLLAVSFANVGELMALPPSRGWGVVKTTEWTTSIRRTFVVLPYDASVAEMWAPLHVKLRGHLQRGGANDLWVAASALTSDPPLPVATNNLSDFRTIAAHSTLRLIHPDIDPTPVL